MIPVHHQMMIYSTAQRCKMFFINNLSSLVSNQIHRFCKASQVKKHIITDLKRQSNIRFLSIEKTPISKVAGTSRDIMYSSTFASGRVLTTMMLESVLSSSPHQPYQIDIFRNFCGMRYKKDFDIETTFNLMPSNLCYVALPEHLFGKTFGYLYQFLAETKGIIPIGLLRDNQQGHSFVYTNPPFHLTLLSSDLVYVLAHPGILS